MAHSRHNVITRTYSGKIGKVCLQQDGVIRSLPEKSPKNWSKKQVEHLTRFEQAKEYGRRAVADPMLSEHYAAFRKRWRRKLKNTGVYQLAIRDFMHTPEIHEASFEQTGENAGGLIRITAMDKFRISRVGVSLLSPGGVLLEEGMASSGTEHVFFKYVILDPALMKPGTTCMVRAWDIPGNVTEKKFSFFD
jgi:hypothetical protein